MSMIWMLGFTDDKDIFWIIWVDAALSQDNSWGHGGARDNASTQPDKAAR